MKDIQGETILVTGAASGLGKCIASRCITKGAKRVILWDVQEEDLKQTVEEFRELSQKPEIQERNPNQPRTEIMSRVINLASRDAIYQAAKELESDNVEVDIVVNNAGLITGKNFMDIPDERIDLTMHVNTMAHMWMAKAFLPGMMKRNKGHFANVSSAAAFVAAPAMTDYAASKFAARGFAEALNAELNMRKGNKIRISVLCPAHIDTKLFEGFKITGIKTMTPEYVAARLIEAIECETELVMLPRYTLPTLLPMSIAQMLGYLNIPYLEPNSPMHQWTGTQANRAFDAMSKESGSSANL